MMKRALIIVFSVMVLTACTSNKERGVQTVSSDTSNQSEVSSLSEESETKSRGESKPEYSFVPYNEVHKFKNTPRSESKLDDKGIYRYDFLKKDDAVYDMMSYEEVDDIYPVQKQDKIEVTLGTNFTIDGYNFNFDGLNGEKLYKNIIGQGSKDSLSGTLKNGASDSGGFKLPSQVGEVTKPVYVDYTRINPSRREVPANEAPITSLSVSHIKGLAYTKENLGARISYEGINFFITRTEFIDNVKIKNPIYHDENFYYGKEYNKKFKNVEISYVLDPGSDGDVNTGNDNSYVTFKFTDEILTSVEVNCQLSYLGIEIE